MGRQKRINGLWAAVAVMGVGWVWSVSCAAWAEEAAGSGPHLSGGGSPAGSVAHTLSAREPRLRLTRMAHVGPKAADDSSLTSGSVSDRQQLALSLAANDLVERLASAHGRQRGLFRTLRAAARIADTPNRALCMLTGADRARLDVLKRRVSLTWFVSW